MIISIMKVRRRRKILTCLLMDVLFCSLQINERD